MVEVWFVAINGGFAKLLLLPHNHLNCMLRPTKCSASALRISKPPHAVCMICGCACGGH